MVQLKPMDQTAFSAYLDESIRSYAEQNTVSGRWSAEEAVQQSTEEFQRLLPEGVASKDNYLYVIVDDATQTEVGMLWYAVTTPNNVQRAFLYEIRIADQYQGKGYGSQAMLIMEEQLRALGINSIGLHVFGHNRRAWALYERLGYSATNVNMVKQL